VKHRNPIVVILLTFITFGIYALYWQVKTKLEMNRVADAKIPTAWLLIVPLVNIWWLWKYSEGVDKTTGGKVSTILAFVLLFLLGVFGMAIIQFEFNKVGDTAVAAQPEVLDTPAPGFGAPVETSSAAGATVPTAESAPVDSPVAAPIPPAVPTTAPTAPETTPVAAAPAPEEQPVTETTDASSDSSQPPTQQV
jgi:hypothetical protein